MSRQERRARSGIRRSSPASPPAGEQPSPAAMTALAPRLTLDALGKKCPVPIIMLADRIGEVRVGEAIAVLADDPAAKTDLPAWCALKSQEFVRADAMTVGWSFLVRRSY